VLADILEKHERIITSWSVLEFDHEDLDIRLKARVDFTDGSVLFIRQVVLDGEMLKYAYQWQSVDGVLIMRWDNASHWEDIVTHPHHKHIRIEGKIHVYPSNGGDLSTILKDIAEIIQPSHV